MPILKFFAAHLSERWQTELKRLHFGKQIKKGTFRTDEPEYKILSKFLSEDDWVIDIGANIGQYTKRLSELVGPNGRVIAFEPVPTTFSLLSANTLLFKYQNVTLVNAAVSDKLGIAGISIPKFSTGLNNYYEAHLENQGNCDLSIMTISIDSILLDKTIKLIKIDTEGHEEFVIKGLQNLIHKDHPILIIETRSNNFIKEVEEFGYTSERINNSPNVLFSPI